MALNVTSVNVSFPTSEWLQDQTTKMSAAAGEMAIDILNIAIINAPKASGALVRSGRAVKTGPTEYSVVFGNNAVKYARRREYENKKNPQTLHYLENAGDSVQRGDVTKYFR